MKTFTAILSLAVFLTLPAEAGEWRYESDPSGFTKGRLRYHSEYFDNTPYAYGAFTIAGENGDVLFLTLRLDVRRSIDGEPNFLGWAHNNDEDGFAFVPLSSEGWGSEAYKVRCAASGADAEAGRYSPCGPEAGDPAWVEFQAELRPQHWDEFMAKRDSFDLLWIDLPNSLYLDLDGLADAICEHVASADHECHGAAPAMAFSDTSVEPTDETRYALKNSNVRDAPDTQGAKIAVLPKGSAITVSGFVQGTDWLRVALDDGRTGYVFASLLGETAPGADGGTVAASTGPSATTEENGWFEPENTYVLLRPGGVWTGTSADGCEATLTLAPYDSALYEWVEVCPGATNTDSGEYALYPMANISLPKDGFLDALCTVRTNRAGELQIGGCMHAGTYRKAGSGASAGDTLAQKVSVRWREADAGVLTGHGDGSSWHLQTRQCRLTLDFYDDPVAGEESERTLGLLEDCGEPGEGFYATYIVSSASNVIEVWLDPNTSERCRVYTTAAEDWIKLTGCDMAQIYRRDG